MTARGDGAAPAKPILYINGKFYSGAINGVHRVADRLIRELDALAEEGADPAAWDMRLLLPRDGHWAPSLRHIAPVPQRGGHTQRWEQAVLPFVARDGVLASFANLAPVLHRRKLTLVHDAQFRLSPQSYAWRRRWGYRTLIAGAARSSRIVVTVSDYARDMLSTFGIAAAERIRVVHNGGDHLAAVDADPLFLARHRLAPGGYALLFGATAAYKNVAVAVAAAYRLPADISLVVIGLGRETLAAHGIVAPPGAVFVGAVDDPSLKALYQAAHCLLYPSRTEGFGLPPLEAMACGCPVVAAPAGAMPEICRDAVLYAGLDDPEDWAAAVLRLRHEPLRRAKIDAGHSRADAFTWRAAGIKLAAAIGALMGAADPDRNAGVPG